jgi:AcrR family transcriptional regulator
MAVARPPILALDSSPSTIRYQQYPIDIGYETCLILGEFVTDGRLTREARAVGSRRRGKVLEAAIFEIVLQELAETGYVNLSIERVAARAGTSKPVIYRRWPTRARLVYVALRANQPVLSSEAPDTGTVRGDLMIILQRISEMVDELSPEVMFGLIAELLHESESTLFAEVHERNAEIMREYVTL